MFYKYNEKNNSNPDQQLQYGYEGKASTCYYRVNTYKQRHFLVSTKPTLTNNSHLEVLFVFHF